MDAAAEPGASGGPGGAGGGGGEDDGEGAAGTLSDARRGRPGAGAVLQESEQGIGGSQAEIIVAAARG